MQYNEAIEWCENHNATVIFNHIASGVEIRSEVSWYPVKGNSFLAAVQRAMNIEERENERR